MLFRITNDGKAELIEEQHFDFEKDVQKLIEKNLCNLFPDLRLTFLKSEFCIDNFRFDSVAFDGENKVFYIIEYKKVKNSGLMDQGLAYLSTLLEKKYEFIKLLESNGIDVKNNAIDWESTRVIFISPSYNSHQLKVAELKNVPFLLYKFSKYANGLFSLDKIESKKNDSADVIKKIIEPENEKVFEEIKVYSEKDHMDKAPSKIIDIYDKIKTKILEIDGDITIEPKKNYIAFKGVTNICDIEFAKKHLLVFINLAAGKLKDYYGITKLMTKEDGTKIGHHGNGDYQVKVDSCEVIDHLVDLIKQSYEING